MSTSSWCRSGKTIASFIPSSRSRVRSQTGDVIVVRLTVSATHDEQYLEIEDPIPAGFEFIEQEGLYELKEKPPWWDFYYTQREFHDDRAALFSTTYRARAGAVPLSFEGRDPRNVSGESGARAAHVRARAAGVDARGHGDRGRTLRNLGF